MNRDHVRKFSLDVAVMATEKVHLFISLANNETVTRLESLALIFLRNPSEPETSAKRIQLELARRKTN